MDARLLLLALLSSLAGCYNYVPLTTLDPQPGIHVTAELTDAGTVGLENYLGANVAAVDGRLVSFSDTAVTISVVAARNRNGVEHYWKGEVVSLPRGDVARLRQRKFAAQRSVLLVVAGAGGSVALLEAFGVFNTGAGGLVTPPPSK